MPMKFKVNVLEALREKGYSTYKLQAYLGQSTIQKLRTSEPVSWKSIETICGLLDCQPGDILEYIEE